MSPVVDARNPSLERLIRAARERFAEDGFSATSLDAIVADAGVTKGSLYHHFRSKSELFEAVFERLAAELAEQVGTEALRHSDPWEVAFAGVSAFLDADQDSGVQRIMLLDGLSVLGWDRMRELEAPYGLALIKAVIEMLAASGELRPHDVDVLAHLLFGALVEGALLIARADDADAARQRVERELRALIEGLRA